MNRGQKILIVDDEENIRWVFKKALEKKRYVVHTAGSGEEALKKIHAHDYLLVFSDIFMEGMSGLDLLEQTREVAPHTRVVVMTAQDTMNNTIEAMRKGAYDYISKPFDFNEVYALVEKAVTSGGIEPPPDAPVNTETGEFSVEAIIGKSKKMQEVFKTIGKAATTDLAVLITGESGTGKEMVARALHYYSNRKDHSFICINCAAISRELLESELFGHERGAFTGAVEQKKGKFELANGGTILLDEIGDMELQLQAKILRVLQNHDFFRVGGKKAVQVDVRIIAATNQDLESLMEEKRFREDLFHRLNVINIDMPPLRERREDIILLASHFMRKFSDGLTRDTVYLSPEVEKFFKNYSWRGNIRELENVVKRALVLASSGPILPEHLPPYLKEAEGAGNVMEAQWDNQLEQLVRDFLARNAGEAEGHLYDRLIQAVEKQLFEIMLDTHSGRQVSAAKALGINRNTLKRKIDAMDITIKRKNTQPES